MKTARDVLNKHFKKFGNGLPFIAQEKIITAMEEYAQYKVNELNKSDIIKSVYHQHEHENEIHTRDTCKNCGKSIYE